MTNRSSLVFAVIGAVTLMAAPALAQPQHHKGNHTSQSSRAHVTPQTAQRNANGAFASSPRNSAAKDPTMYLLEHDIPVKDKTSPTMNQ